MTDQARLEKGLVQVFTGEGKGKTSAGTGLAVRALGNGLRVCVIVFMKGDRASGEWVALPKLGATVERYGTGRLIRPGKPDAEAIAEGHRALKAASDAVRGGKFDVVILDEANVAAHWGIVDVDELLWLICAKPANVELVLTGRYADPKVIEKADLATEMRKIKHPFDAGIQARKGIEY